MAQGGPALSRADERSFRADIEGLRAVAILGVVGFHLVPRVAPGGFAGVDVFFVISGFLITRLLLADMSSGTFSFSRFYARRLRRLLPAYFAMILGCLLTALVLFLPPETIRFATISIFSTLYASNFYFMSLDGYFNPASTTSPLLHTWSLSVEEQFYILFPALLFFLHRYLRLHLLAALTATAAASFALGVVMIDVDPTVAFFFPLTRFWQFLTGGILAYLTLNAPVRISRLLDVHAVARDALLVIGLALIAASYFFFDRATEFPGWPALAPTFGAALVILAGVGGLARFTGWTLTNPLARFVGRISYSLYLWHWPLFTFYRLTYGPTGVVEEASLLVVAFSLAYLSWRFVEVPFQTMSLARPTVVFRLAGLASVTAVTVAVTLIVSDGLPQRFRPNQVAVADHLGYVPRQTGPRCFLGDAHHRDDAAYDVAGCLRPEAPGPRLAFVGDSHAHHYLEAARHLWPQATVTLIGASGCRPTVDATGAPACVGLMQRAFADLIPNGRFDQIVLAGQWNAGDLFGLQHTVRSLAARQIPVVVLGPIVEYRNSLPRLLAFDQLDRSPETFRYWSWLAQKREVDTLLRGALADENATYVSLLDLMCDRATCQVFAAEGVPMQWDHGHLTHAGARLLLKRMEQLGVFADRIRNAEASIRADSGATFGRGAIVDSARR